MTTTNFGDVGDFHRQFDLHASDEGPGPVLDMQDEATMDLLGFREKFLSEELDEFTEGLDELDHAKMFDALLDLVYVAMGTAHLLGYPWQEGWEAVQAANMSKVRASKDGSDSKRGSSFDVVKPLDFQPPDIAKVLERHGFENTQ